MYPNYQVLDMFQRIHSLRSMAVLSSRAHERRSREKKKTKKQVARAPISSRFLCPHQPLLLSAPNQNRHATQAKESTSVVDHLDQQSVF